MKVAIVHDWLTGFRGGEKVLEVLCQEYPEAPLYTLVHIKGSVPRTIETHAIHESFIAKLPRGRSHYRHYLPFFPLAAETLIREKYDLVLSTSSAVAKSVRLKSGTKHWCYIHSPMRYVWDRFDDYFGPERVGFLASILFFKPIAKALAWYDKITSSRVHSYVANSRFVAKRVQDFYGKTAEVICPPVDIERFSKVVRNPKDYYLFFSALVPYKRTDLAIQACQGSRRKLVVLGNGPELEKLKEIADPNWIQFITSPNDALVDKHYAEAKGLIFPAVEDFGIVPVEALAAGLPVIGLRAGGLLDSQTEATCEFFEEQTAEALIEALSRFEHRTFDIATLKSQASLFSKENFKKKINSSISRLLNS